MNSNIITKVCIKFQLENYEKINCHNILNPEFVINWYKSVGWTEDYNSNYKLLNLDITYDKETDNYLIIFETYLYDELEILSCIKVLTYPDYNGNYPIILNKYSLNINTDKNKIKDCKNKNYENKEVLIFPNKNYLSNYYYEVKINN